MACIPYSWRLTFGCNIGAEQQEQELSRVIDANNEQRSGMHDPVGTERAMVVACCRSVLEPTQVKQVCERTTAIAWQTVVELGVNHRVAFFVRQHLDGLLPPWSVLDGVRRSLSDQLRQQTNWALLLLGPQRQLADNLEQTDIPAVWLKGFALSEQLELNL
jgi:hypothetical protein